MDAPRTFMVAQDDWREVLTPLEVRAIEVRATKGWRWLRPAAQWFVRRFGMNQVRPIRVRSFHAADGHTLLERMHLQQRDMLRIYNREARTVLVGPDTFGAVVCEARDLCQTFHPFSIGEVPVRLGYGPKIVVRGVEVVLIPWMSGALLVPGSYSVEGKRP